MLRSTNRLLNTPLMLCITTEKVELFIYLLYKFSDFYREQGLQLHDIEGNNLLHLMAQSHYALYFCQILKHFDNEKFQAMLNQQNMEGNTPLFIAINMNN